MFNFDEDQFKFGYQFAKGRLKYYMAIQSFNQFIGEYIYYKRGVREQVLALSNKQKQDLYIALHDNYLPENRYYNYDFFYDNCSSRIRDILIAVLGDGLIIGKHESANKNTFREIIDKRLRKQPWLDLGIDLVLGKRIDIKASNYHMMFLPIFLEEILDSSSVIMQNGDSISLVRSKHTLLNNTTSSKENSEWTNLYFWIILVFTLLLFILKIKYISPIWYGILLFMCGILGILLIFMWLGTDHQATKINYNLIWANPLHLFTLLSLLSYNFIKQLKTYYLLITILLFSTVLFWIILPQEFHPSARPLILSLTIIYYYLFKKSKKLGITS